MRVSYTTILLYYVIALKRYVAKKVSLNPRHVSLVNMAHINQKNVTGKNVILHKALGTGNNLVLHKALIWSGNVLACDCCDT